MNKVEELASLYVAQLRSIYLTHQNHHWLVSGNDFYGNHLLFERIYKSAAEDVDLAAEKFIGLFGKEVLDPQMQAQLVGKLLEEFSGKNELETSLAIEKKFLAFSEKFYGLLKSENKMSLGLDDMIMSISSNRETACFLLQQTLEKGDDMSRVAERIQMLTKLSQEDQFKNEQKAYSLLKSEISSYLTMKLGNGNAAQFSVKLSRAGNTNNGYTIIITLSKNSPETKFQQDLERDGATLVKKVPFFANKDYQVSVVVF
jgi:DNA-binding ferritin-like protein